jgi:hypothetical protein
MRNWTLLIAAVLLLAVSCTVEPQPAEEPTNAPVELTFSATWGEEPATRTSLQDHGVVYWNPGDAVNIFYGKSMAGRFESTLTETAPVSDFTGSLSISSESFDDEDGDLSFWAVYPYDDENTYDGEGVVIELPGVQTAAPYTFSGNLNPAIAVSDGMELSFYNVGGLFCFSVQGEGYYAASLRGNDGEALAGTLHVVVDEDGIPSVDQVTNGVSSIYLNAPESGTFEPGTLYYFVVIPQVLEQGVTLSLYKEGETGEVTRNVPVNIRRSKIVRILNADIDPTYTVVGGSFVLNVTGATPVTLADGSAAYEVVIPGVDAAEAELGFESYKVVDGTTYPVAIHVSGYAADEAGVPGAFSETIPAGFDGLLLETAGDNWTGLACALVRADGATMPYDAVAVHAAKLAAKGDNGFNAGAPQDLSLYDIADLTTPRASGIHVTANCYVVDRAGWYMFPIVYGNAVDGTRPGNVNGCNLISYTDGTGQSNPPARYLWHDFERADGQIITSPYILTDMGLTAGDVEAVIVWEDVDASAPLVQPGDVDVIAGPGGFLDPAGNAVNVPYIKFKVDRQNIRQGNVMIAVRRKSDSVILWSWHIWITDTDMSPVTLYSRSTVVPSNDILRENLGWCDVTEGEAFTYPAKAWYVKVSQTEGDADPVIVKVVRPEVATSPAMVGCGTFYQWGRKDPLLPGKGLANKAAFSPAGYAITTGAATIPVETAPDCTASTAIQNPYVLCFAESMWIGPNPPQTRSDLWNLWNMTETYPAPSTDVNATGEDKVVVKTVYDPCPPGYSVPNYMAFSVFSHTMANYEEWTDVNAEDRNGDGVITMEGDFENGWYFYTSDDPDTRETVFFATTYYRAKETGKVDGGMNGYHWTAKPKGTRYGTTMTILTGPYGRATCRADGFAVRPAAEK